MEKETLTEEQLEFILGQVRGLKEKNPTAQVFYDPEYNGVRIVFPMPKDYYKIKSIEFK